MITTPQSIFGSRFTVADRCDRCGAQAKVLVVLHGGGELMFCGHHGRAHRPVLESIAQCFEDHIDWAVSSASAA